MNTIKYLVYSGEGSDNLLAWFDEEVEAIAFAKENVDEQTRVEKAECDLAEDGFLNEIIDSKTIWSYLDNNVNEFDQEFPEEEPDEFDTDFPESDIINCDGSDDECYGDKAWDLPDSSIKEAVEALEENESEVECKCCFELFPKEDCVKTEKGYLCKKCNQELHSHQGTNLDLIDKDPFSLDYEDPRDPEEEEEPEVKEEPVDANEVRKFEAGIEEKLEEHINDRPADIESDQEYQGVDNAVVDCKKYTLVAHSEDEKPIDCKLEKPALEEPLAGEEVDGKFYEDLSDEEKKALDEEIENLDLEEAKKDDELPVDPEAAKLEVHTMLNDLVADEIEAVNGYEEAKAEILDAPIAHKDIILDKVDHIEDEEKEHIDELIDATTEIPFDKEEAPAPVVEEPVVEEPIVEEGLNENANEDEAKTEADKLIANILAKLSDNEKSLLNIETTYQPDPEIAPSAVYDIKFDLNNKNKPAVKKLIKLATKLLNKDTQGINILDPENYVTDIVDYDGTFLEDDWLDILYDEDHSNNAVITIYSTKLGEEEPLDQEFPEVEENLEERVDLPAFDSDVKVGDSILIVNMEGEPDYCGRKGKVDHIDSLGQLHGTWGGLAVIPGVDKFDIITDECLKEDITKDDEKYLKDLYNSIPKDLKQKLNVEVEYYGDDNFVGDIMFDISLKNDKLEAVKQLGKFLADNLDKEKYEYNIWNPNNGIEEQDIEDYILRYKDMILEAEEDGWEEEDYDEVNYINFSIYKKGVAESLEEAKEAGDKVKSYNDGLKLAKAYNKPVIYGYENKSYGGKFFALDDPIVCNSVVDETKKFKQQYKSCGIVYVAYPDKDFAESLKESMKLSEYWWEDNDPMNQVDKEDGVEYNKFSPEEQAELGCDEDGYYDKGRYVFDSWCGDIFDESDCRYEENFGWLCPQCQAALKSRGEELTFIENESLEQKHDEEKWAIAIDGEQRFVGTESEMKDKMSELENTDAAVAHKIELVKGADVLVNKK